MSIEDKLTALTEAITENTKALHDVLAASANTAPASPPEKAKKPAKKTAKKEKAPEPAKEPDEPTPEPEPEPAKEEAPPEAAKPDDEWASDDDLVNEITEVVKSAITRDPEGAAEVKKKWMAIREGYGVSKMSELKGQTDKLIEALAKAKEL